MKLSEYNYTFNGESCEIYFRPAPSSDFPVINQIFNQHVYALDGWPHKELLEKYYHNNFQLKRPLIIDAGANIGASSIYFLNVWNGAYVVSIEPEKFNYSLLRLNTVGRSILALEGAIGSENGEMYLSDPGHGDVGFRVSDSGDYKVVVYSVDEVIAIGKKNGAEPFICKIDIEGGESELFSKNTAWMDEFALIMIELHDWMLPMQGSSKNFIEAISKLDFEILHKGENLFFFNKKFLA